MSSPFDWTLFAHLADALNRVSVRFPTRAELLQRAAIGRAYYASFCVAREHFMSRGWIPSTNGRSIHELVQKQLELHHGSTIASEFKRLRRLRNSADYDAVFEEHHHGNLTKSAEAALVYAHAVVEAVRGMR